MSQLVQIPEVESLHPEKPSRTADIEPRTPNFTNQNIIFTLVVILSSICSVKTKLIIVSRGSRVQRHNFHFIQR